MGGLGPKVAVPDYIYCNLYIVTSYADIENIIYITVRYILDTCIGGGRSDIGEEAAGDPDTILFLGEDKSPKESPPSTKI